MALSAMMKLVVGGMYKDDIEVEERMGNTRENL